jgi:hypothetical protein
MPAIVVGDITIVQKKGKSRCACLFQGRIDRGVMLLGAFFVGSEAPDSSRKIGKEEI